MEADLEKTYRALAQHLDRLPGGFPPSDTGADLRLLQRLFTPDEAAMAVQLSIRRETAAEIAARIGMDAATAGARLHTMADKGLILPIYSEGEPTRYQAVPFVVGIWEFQVRDVTAELVRDIAEYRRTSARNKKPAGGAIQQMRVVPGLNNIEVRPIALPYERADDLVDAHTTYAVAPCICRRKSRLSGEGCDAPEESCILFGEWAEYYIRTERGRRLQREEVKALLQRADELNLVLQPSNSKRIMFVCCCCGCCCGVLKGLRALPNPAEVVESPFRAELTAESCTGCWVCLGRCQMGALGKGDSTVVLDSSRCIGCGLCVTTCPSEALRLVRRPDGRRPAIPQDLNDTWQALIHAR